MNNGVQVVHLLRLFIEPVSVVVVEPNEVFLLQALGATVVRLDDLLNFNLER